MASLASVSTRYRIEVSGWDAEEEFFVENTELDWSEEAGQKLYLRRVVREGTMVFIRLLQPSARGHSFPIPYLVEKVRTTNTGGGCEVSLAKMHPRNGASASRIRVHQLEPAEETHER